MIKNWITYFPGLQKLSEETLQILIDNAQVMSLRVDTEVFGPGIAPEYFLMLIEGTLRVQQVSESGREIVLYRVKAGESCALTTACLMSYKDYLAEAIVEEDAIAVGIPRSTFDELMSKSHEFRLFVFTAFSQRVTNLFHLIDEILSNRIDIRLAEKLLQLAVDTDELSITHQRLAHELGTAREVISRQVAEFQRRKWIALARGKIRLLDRTAIEDLVRQH